VTIQYHIKQIENLLNKEKIIKYNLLQTSFDIACVKFELSNGNKFIAKYYVNKKTSFNAINAEAGNLKFLNKKFNFFPKIVKFDKSYLIIEYIDNDKDCPNSTNEDFLESIIKLHTVSNKEYGFDFNTQIAALEQVNDFENNWANFFISTRLNPMFELANKIEYMGNFINSKINYLIKDIENFIPNNPPPLLLHGDLWEGNILFKEKKFVAFIDPGSFFGHNEMEVAYLRWFNPVFVDSKFLDKYNDKIKLDKNYLLYEPIYQIYYALSNVALWDKSYIKETKRLIEKLRL
tara:strand:- start:1100 stop:1972 length:873 start_codon:yes stop_codon:yes gene_type:complete